MDQGSEELAFFFGWTDGEVSGTMVKNPPANAGDTRAEGSVTGSGRSPGVGKGKPL